MSETEESLQPSNKAILKALAIQLGVVQREAKELNIPTLVIVEGLDASMKGQILNQLLLEMDARTYKVHSTHASDSGANKYPLLNQFWKNTPARGMVQFLDRSAYYLVLDAWAEGKISDGQVDNYLEYIRQFEQQLHDDNVVVIKIFLTVSKKEQSRRLTKLEQNPKTTWRVTAKDWKRHRQYKSYLNTVTKFIDKSDHDFAPWTVISTDEFKEASIQVNQTIINRIHKEVEAVKNQQETEAIKKNWVPYNGHDYLAEVEFPGPMDRVEYKAALKEKQAIIHDLVHEVHYLQIPVVMVYCGSDAAGKGGCIKRLLQGMDPRGYDVIPVGAPTKEEFAQHYMWRFWKQMPRQGHISIFDRSWYGRVLVERVEGFCSNEEWERAYREMNETEKHLHEFGTIIIKFWLHIDKETQLERFKAREENPLKRWKITDEDWRNHKQWDRYIECVNEMIANTNTDYAPWNIVASTCKMRARLETLDTTIAALKAGIKKYKKPVM
ncbi:hypothetical protein MLD52_05260 [Puniceicoccaceae bacterium K14]|nr:hypothetical protein [Puniceicoccaceae bacterium K14]